MFFVANPWLLLGLLFLAVPILIHLFNKSRGKLVKIGHIALIRQAKRVSVTEIKINHWLLLLLRLIIFTCATLLISEAYLKGKSTGEGDTAIMVTANWLSLATNAEITELINRKTKGLNLLSADFTPLDKTVIKQLKAKQNDNATQLQLWPLIAERLSQLSPNDHLEIYSTNRQSFSQQVKPLLTQKITWYIKKDQEKTTTTSPSIPADFTVVIYHDLDRELAFLESALVLIKKYQLPQLKLSFVSSEKALTQQADFIFYLSEKPLSADLLAQIKTGTVVVKDASEEQLTTRGWPFNFEEAVLTPLSFYQFPSRFEPQWSNIVFKAEFPAQLGQWLFSHQKLPSFDKVILAPQELKLSTLKPLRLTQNKQSLYAWIIALLVLAWLAERWLSERLLRVK